MIYRLDMDADVRGLISHLPPSRKRQVRESLQEVIRNPHSGKPLQEELIGLWSYRVGSLRIIYEIDEKRRKIHLVVIGPRRTVYEEVTRHFKPKKTD